MTDTEAAPAPAAETPQMRVSVIPSKDRLARLIADHAMTVVQGSRLIDGGVEVGLHANLLKSDATYQAIFAYLDDCGVFG